MNALPTIRLDRWTDHDADLAASFRPVLYNANLSAGARCVYGTLLLNIDEHGNVANTRQGDLATILNCSERSVRRYIDELIEENLIAVKRQDGQHGREANIYTLIVEFTDE